MWFIKKKFFFTDLKKRVTEILLIKNNNKKHTFQTKFEIPTKKINTVSGKQVRRIRENVVKCLNRRLDLYYCITSFQFHSTLSYILGVNIYIR